jgi:hypothetical protein
MFFCCFALESRKEALEMVGQDLKQLTQIVGTSILHVSMWTLAKDVATGVTTNMKF